MLGFVLKAGRARVCFARHAVAVAQFGRALDCGSRCRGFNPRRSPPAESLGFPLFARFPFSVRCSARQGCWWVRRLDGVSRATSRDPRGVRPVVRAFTRGAHPLSHRRALVPALLWTPRGPRGGGMRGARRVGIALSFPCPARVAVGRARHVEPRLQLVGRRLQFRLHLPADRERGGLPGDVRREHPLHALLPGGPRVQVPGERVRNATGDLQRPALHLVRHGVDDAAALSSWRQTPPPPPHGFALDITDLDLETGEFRTSTCR
jgi:hypothetical protein